MPINPILRGSGERTETLSNAPTPSQERSPATPASSSFQVVWQGEWKTSEGRMTLQFPTDGQDETTISGLYDQNSGRIEGYIQAQVLKGYWAEKGSSQRCNESRLGTYHWGRLEFVINAAGDAFNGKWSYCDAEPNLAWTGTRNGR